MGLSPPRLLGRYALYDRIAAGGMATVHLGRLLGSVGFSRTVAIKRLQPQFAEDPEFVTMFLDEARLAARIRHPNVVPTLDVVSTEGELFLVMEYVQGDSLARLTRAAHARGERPDPAMIATLMVGVLSGLHAAHEAKDEQGVPLGIVHRDVSPHNVLVGIDGVARVLDFGIAKAASRTQTTLDGQLKGKLAYMAPEQVRGVVTRETDIYAASVVFWEALVGRRAFPGDSEGEVFSRVQRGGVEPASQHAPGIGPALDAAILRGLDPDPAKRFPTAREMARAVADAVKLVDPSTIGEWVEGLARQTLDARAELVSSIESDSMTRKAPPEPASSPALAGGVPSSPGIDEIPITTEEPPTQLSSGSVSVPGRAPAIDASPPPRRRWVVAVGAIAAIVGAALLFLGAGRDRGPSPRAEGAPATPPEVPSEQATSAPASPTTTVEAGVATAGSATATPSASARAPALPTRRTPAFAAPAPGHKANCNPPYYLQGGVRVFKTECL